MYSTYCSLLFYFSFDKRQYINTNSEQDILFPTLIDVAGFENENNLTIQEMLRIIIFGRFHTGQSLHTLREYALTHRVEEIREKYDAVHEANKVDRIIFVASALPSVNLPHQLMDAVLKAAHNSDIGEIIILLSLHAGF